MSHKNADPLTLEGVSEGKSVQQSSKDAVKAPLVKVKRQNGRHRPKCTDHCRAQTKGTDQKRPKRHRPNRRKSSGKNRECCYFGS